MHVPMREFLRHWDGMVAGEFIGEGPFAKRPKKGEGFLGVGTEDTDGGGLRVKKVGRESPAEEAEIKQGDVLLRAQRRDDRGQGGSFRGCSRRWRPVTRCELVIKRGGKEIEIEPKLGER